LLKLFTELIFVVVKVFR